jgi:calcineurin-like phosphoesterase family protein
MKVKRGGKYTGKVFFTSDLHLGHGNIIKYCKRNAFLQKEDKQALEENGGSWDDGEWKGSRSSKWKITKAAIREMDEQIIHNINKTVGKNDILWHLGDFAMGRGDYMETVVGYLRRINCQAIFKVWGNHDEVEDLERAGLFQEEWDQVKIEVDGQEIVLNHYAMAIWDRSHRGAWHLYGHSHSGAEPWLNAHMPGRRSMDVGIDNIYKVLGEYRPISFEEVKKIMDKQDGFSMDHHIPRNSTAPTEKKCL